MWQDSSLQIVRVIKYTVLMFCFYPILSTVTTLLIGSDSLIDLSFYEHAKYQLLPSFILGIFMYGVMAKRQVEKAWLNALIVYLLGFALGFIVVSGLMQELYLSPTLVYEMPLSVLSLVIGTILGGRLGSKGLKAT
jgi:hypothetical protein